MKSRKRVGEKEKFEERRYVHYWQNKRKNKIIKSDLKGNKREWFTLKDGKKFNMISSTATSSSKCQSAENEASERKGILVDCS